jgi:HSP20 family protein
MFTTRNLSTAFAAEFDHLFENQKNYISYSKSSVSKTDTGHLILILLPGFTKEEVEVKLEEGNLIVSAKTDRELPSFVQNNVKKTYDLDGLEVDNIDAKLENGILSLGITSKKSPSKVITIK